MNLITDYYEKHAKDFPEKIAIQTASCKISYQNWAERIKKTANWLESLNLPKKTVGILLPNGIPFLQIFAGAASAGWTAVPLDMKWKEAELEKRLLLAAPSLIITIDELVPSIKYANVRTWDSCSNEINQMNTIFQKPIGNPPFYMGFTSGTTGNPKAFIRSHESWIESFTCNRIDFNLKESEHVLIPGALIHSHFLYGAISTLALGGTVYLLEKFSPLQVLDLLQTKTISTIFVVPTMIEALLQLNYKIDAPFTILSSGAKWTEHSKKKIIDMFPQIELFEFYGASELSFVSYLSTSLGMDKAGSVGKPCTGVEVQIRKADNQIAQPQETGKIFVRSKLIFTGYLDPETHAIQTIQDENGWATVNDMGYLDEDGFLYIAGRENNMIIYGGINIFPEEVETILALHPDVEEVAVIGVSNSYWGQIVTAVIKGHAEKLELKRLCKRHLSAYKTPRKWYFLDELPYTTSGKIARSELKEMIERKEGEKRLNVQ
ncbi:AMP-binding protein [Bacillus sp. S/N-304-OC-R1]|uniref:AMP-binding protein n=1 Tax=Bacillus sp. S/N-304-OC-R1 TaxID=2758034 RepID=UPI0021AFC92D|nr:AMP-binding protein [Bacillus sp. S/N-304-OC-R1]